MKYVILKNLCGQYFMTDFCFTSQNEADACCSLMNDGHQSNSYHYVVATVKED